MKMELLPPNTTASQLQQRLLQLKEALLELTKNQKNQQMGHLRVSQRGSARPQYYHYTTPTDFTGKYIRKKNLTFAKNLAQKDYEENIIPLLQKEITVLEEYLTQTSNGHAISEFYESLCPARGERVRSKSEIIIADALHRHGIPYRYEFPLTLQRSEDNSDSRAFGSTITLHPDFLCLNVRTRAEFYWEHFGLMDDPDYSNNAAGKLLLYTENGILAGRNLIITMETQSEPLSTRVLEKLISEFLT